MVTRRRFTADFKARVALEALRGDKTILEIATKHKVHPLPIRLTPMTATCRVPPLSRVKLGIGWSRGVARDAEQ